MTCGQDMGNDTPEPTKRELLETLLAGGMVLIHLDARVRGVDVPPGLRDEGELGLNLSYRFEGPLAVEDEQVQATLSFAGVPYACTLPFEAIYAMVTHDSGEGYFFPADAPPTALAALAAVLEEESAGSPGHADASASGAQVSRQAAVSMATPTGPSLSLIDCDGDALDPAADTQTFSNPAEQPAIDGEAPTEAEDAAPRPRLRLVK